MSKKYLSRKADLMIWVWIGLATVAVVLAGGAVGRFVWKLRPPTGIGDLPSTALERLGWIGLVVTSVVGAGIVGLVAWRGPTGFQDTAPRAIFAILMLTALGVWTAAWGTVKRQYGAIVVDERDRAILARSLSVESMVVLLSLVVWTVGLTEVYWERGEVPLGHLQLMFWTTFVGGAFGRALGLVMGYRREITVDA